MHLVRAFLGLPPSLLLLVLAQAEDAYAQQGLPTAIRKMGLEPGEKFYPEQYYAFGQNEEEIYGGQASSSSSSGSGGSTGKVDTNIQGRSIAALFGRRPPSLAGASGGHNSNQARWPVAVREETNNNSNNSNNNDTDHAPDTSVPGNDSAASLLPQAYLPPYPVHLEQKHTSPAADDRARSDWSLFHRAADALARLQPRQWGCPGGTSSCEGIGYPYSCCATGETCYKVTDTGLGPVGCCPSGSTCGGSVSSCGSGSQACAADLGGGCCISGYTCEGVGCVQTGSTTATATATATTSLVTTTTVVPASQASTVVVTVIITETTAGVVATTTATLTSTPVTTVTELSTTGVAPVKPTSSAAAGDTASTTTTTTTRAAATTTSSSSNVFSQGYCPTGYYACGAVAASGCCQVGRDCQSTSCPASEATVVASNSGGAVVVAGGGTTNAATGTCAGGWYLCPTSVGPIAGCCPSGYDCGTASCSLVSASSTAEVQKELPGTSGASPSAMVMRAESALWLWGLVALTTAGLLGVL